MENDEKSKSKSVRTRETLKPFHLLPTSDVLGELISKAEIKKISLDEKSSCQRFDLSVIPIGASNTLAQTLALCVDTTTKRVLYEEEPYWWSSASSASTLRRTFSQYSQMGGTLIPTLVKVSIDGRDTYSLQITAFDGTPDITPSTFQINMGGH